MSALKMLGGAVSESGEGFLRATNCSLGCPGTDSCRCAADFVLLPTELSHVLSASMTARLRKKAKKEESGEHEVLVRDAGRMFKIARLTWQCMTLELYCLYNASTVLHLQGNKLAERGSVAARPEKVQSFAWSYGTKALARFQGIQVSFRMPSTCSPFAPLMSVPRDPSTTM